MNDSYPRNLSWSRRGQGILLWGVVLLVLGPLVWSTVPAEIARWHAAAALEAQLNGELQQAITSVGRSIAWQPENPAWLVERARLQVDHQQAKAALADLDAALAAGAPEFSVLMYRAQAWQGAGEFPRAVVDWKKIKQLNQENNYGLSETEVANGLAYARSLAGLELNEALVDAERAVESVRDRLLLLNTKGVFFLSAGLAYHTLGKHVRARQLMTQGNRATQRLLERYGKRRVALGDRADGELQRKYTLLRQCLAAGLYARAEVNQSLKLEEQAEADLKLIEQLGLDANDSMGWSLSLNEVQNLASSNAAYLDTRGWIRLQLGEASAAIQDLNDAVRLADALTLANVWQLDLLSYQTIDLRPGHLQRASSQRTLAVLLYHRSEAFGRNQESENAEYDRQRIVELGFTPDASLF